MYKKLFLQWIGVKEALHDKKHKAPYVSEGDIWWASVGENIGYEMNGKSDKFSRPVIIYKKLARGFYCVIPTTTQIKTGSWFVHFKQHGEDRTACLHQVRTIDYRRLWSKVGELDDSDMKRMKTGFKHLYT